MGPIYEVWFEGVNAVEWGVNERVCGKPECVDVVTKSEFWVREKD